MLNHATAGTLPVGMTAHESTNVVTTKADKDSVVTLSISQMGNPEPGRGITVEMEILESDSN